MPRSGVVVAEPGSEQAPRWFPSSEPPRWQIDSTSPRVDAWRDLIVRDVVCTGGGACIERATRVRARWSATCSCYIFADALNRIWRVE